MPAEVDARTVRPYKSMMVPLEYLDSKLKIDTPRVRVSIFLVTLSRVTLGERSFFSFLSRICHAEGEHLALGFWVVLSAGKDFAQHVGARLKTDD